MLNEIIEEVSRRVRKAEGNFPVFEDRRYSPVEFSHKNYSEIGRGNGRVLLLVDGGNSELLQMPGTSLQIMRNAAVVMKGNRLLLTRKREFYVLAATNGKQSATGKIFGEGKVSEVSAGSMELSRFCDTIRRSSEIKFATEMMEEVPRDSVAVLDGSLEASNAMEKTQLEGLYKAASAMGVSVAAISKTTGLRTERGESYPAMLNERAGSGKWHYHPVVSIRSEDHKAEMLFAKFHEKSGHVFRTDVRSNNKESVPAIAAELAENSRDLTFPGYPYGLILADKLARVSERETGVIKARLAAAAGNKWSKIKAHLAAGNAHEILDSM